MAAAEPNPAPLRDALIQAGVAELETYGIEQFSVRRVAASCGVSCAAPYKHFKDKHAFVCAVISYINRQWALYQRRTAQVYDSVRDQLLAVCMAYVKFLAENPQFRSIIMQKYTGQDEEYNALRGKLNQQTYRLVSRYCKQAGMADADRRRKTYIVRSLIYGAALMFDNGELEYNEENLELVRDSLIREFDLP